MGHHDQFHRRNKHNRIANDEEEKLKELIARFSPTADYPETLTLTNNPTNIPPDTFTTPPPATTAPPATTNPLPTTQPATTPATTGPAPSVTDTNAITAVGPNTSVTDPLATDTTVAPPATTVDPATLTTMSLPTLTIPSTTVSIPTDASVTSAAASATSTDSGGSSTNVGGIVGGIAGALLGLVVLGYGIRYFLRRRNRVDITPFDAHDFRRSALMLDSGAPHSGGDPNGGYPEMMQHRNIGAASPAPTFGTLYGRPGPGQARDLAINTGMAQDHHGAMGAPHPYGAPYGQYSPPETAHSAHPMYSDAAYNPNAGAYGQNPFSPAQSSYHGSVPGTPSTLVPGAGVGMAGAFGAAGAIAGAGMLTRQNSSATHLSNPQANGAPNQQMPNGYSGEGGYVDLNRSSVTPFQQAQYAEISERLGAPVPNGLSTPAAVAAMAAKNQRELPPPPQEHEEGPFADPNIGSHRSITPPTVAAANVPASLAPGNNGARGSAISAATTMSDARPSTDTQDITNDFPAPPSPGIGSPLPSPGFMSAEGSSKARVDSTPPTLPEIFIGSSSASGISTPQRVVSYDFPTSVRGSDMGHSDIGHSSEGHNNGAVPNSNLGTPINAGYPSSIFGAYAGQGYPSGMSAANQAAPGMGQDVLVHPSLSGFKFPATPSPLASSFGVITPEAGRARGFAADQDRVPAPPTPSASQLSHEIKPEEPAAMPTQKKAPAPATAEKKRPDTVYDDDDAYGGI